MTQELDLRCRSRRRCGLRCVRGSARLGRQEGRGSVHPSEGERRTPSKSPRSLSFLPSARMSPVRVVRARMCFVRRQRPARLLASKPRAAAAATEAAAATTAATAATAAAAAAAAEAAERVSVAKPKKPPSRPDLGFRDPAWLGHTTGYGGLILESFYMGRSHWLPSV